MDKPITEFRGEYRWLSNFWECVPFTYDGIQYTSVEAAYQAHKTLNISDRLLIASLSPGGAKRAGRLIVPLRHDWEDIKIDIMRELLALKFSQPDLKLCLMQTGDTQLIEGNYWNDTFWGVCNGTGMNWLGILLMDLRFRLQQQPTPF